ncbi:hypothetical protein TNCV_2721871 [Trichonephila clavipes]|nr:hypothetical protein TNCV_2721871 [Trichonephila clavipes]
MAGVCRVTDSSPGITTDPFVFGKDLINLNYRSDPKRLRGIESYAIQGCGRGSLVAKVMDSWQACHEFEPSAAEEPPSREAMHVTSV